MANGFDKNPFAKATALLWALALVAGFVAGQAATTNATSANSASKKMPPGTGKTTSGAGGAAASKSAASKSAVSKSTVSKSGPAPSAASKTGASKSGATASARLKSGKSATVARRPTQQQPTPERFKEIQKALADRGYFAGQVDGAWGSDSVEALKHFQRDQSIEDDGKLGALSLIGLGLGPKRSIANSGTAEPPSTSGENEHAAPTNTTAPGGSPTPR